MTRAVAIAPTALPRPAVVCNSTKAGELSPKANPAAMPTTDPSCKASTNRRSEGKFTRKGISVDPGLEKMVVKPSSRIISKQTSLIV